MKKVLARDLRSKENLRKISSNMPGYYKWWASKESLALLLNSKYLKDKYLKTLLPHLTTSTYKGKKYYYIYVGIAVKESIQSRLDWHVNQHHTKSSVESGFLSTFRQSISSLVAFNQFDESATNEFIDTLLIKYYPINLPIKSNEAKEKIEKLEKTEISNHVLPINIKDNKDAMVKDFLKELKVLRKSSKQNNNA
ncbi:MAG: hypothetical protein HFI87_03390 [Bacilli bacterium]|nr:hypothetical protein [Bacilli bacterium]